MRSIQNLDMLMILIMLFRRLKYLKEGLGTKGKGVNKVRLEMLPEKEN